MVYRVLLSCIEGIFIASLNTASYIFLRSSTFFATKIVSAHCTKMAKSGMNPKTLEHLMGHSDISATLNVYTHEDFTGAEEELQRLSII